MQWQIYFLSIIEKITGRERERFWVFIERSGNNYSSMNLLENLEVWMWDHKCFALDPIKGDAAKLNLLLGIVICKQKLSHLQQTY